MMEDAKALSTYQRQRLAVVLLEFLRSQYAQRKSDLHSIRLASMVGSQKTYVLCLFQIKGRLSSAQIAAQAEARVVAVLSEDWELLRRSTK